MLAIVVVLVSTLSAGFCAVIADQRDREPFWFAVGGLLLGVVGILIATRATSGADLERGRNEAFEAAKERGRHLASKLGY